MAEDDGAADTGGPDPWALIDHKLDTVAGALAAIASSHTDLLAHVAESEARRSQDAQDVAQRLDALERQVLALPTSGLASAPGADGGDGSATANVDVERLQADVALALDVLARLAEAVEHLDARTEDRLAAVRDAAAAPVADLQALLSARTERDETQLADLTAAVQGLAAEGPAPIRERLAELSESVERLAARPADGGSAAVLERIDELAAATQAITWQLPELVQELAAVREQVEAADVAGALADTADALSGKLTLHTDTALAGTLRLIDDRLAALRKVLAEGAGPPSGVGGFEAGAVMGAAQAAWNRLEQRLDNEFDDLGRQLQAMGTLLEQAVATTEAVANRPVVTGDQIRRAASAVRDSVVSASRSRRDRRGGPRGLSSGS